MWGFGLGRKKRNTFYTLIKLYLNREKENLLPKVETEKSSQAVLLQHGKGKPSHKNPGKTMDNFGSFRAEAGKRE